MVLMVARQEAGPQERWPKTLNKELENNSRMPRDLVKNRHRAQLTLCHGKMKKGDDVAGYEDEDAVRTSVSQDRVTATLCTEELFLRTQYIALSAYQTGQNVGGGYGWSTHHI
jgi:hypothetical protein